MVYRKILSLVLLTAGLGLLYGQTESLSPSTLPETTIPSPSLSFEGSLVWQGQSWPTTQTETSVSPNGIESSPLFVRFGAYYHLRLDTVQSVRIGLDLFTDEYVYKSALGKAFPTQAETGIESGELGMVLALGPAAAYALDFNIDEKLSLGMDVGIQFLPRLALYGLDGSTGFGKITEYLNGSGKFIYTTLGLHSRYDLREGVGFGPWIRTTLPIYRLWDGENLPFWDTMFVALGFDVQIDLD